MASSILLNGPFRRLCLAEAGAVLPAKGIPVCHGPAGLLSIVSSTQKVILHYACTLVNTTGNR